MTKDNFSFPPQNFRMPKVEVSIGCENAGESGALQYAAHGGVKISAHVEVGLAGGLRTLVVKLDIQPGWHINAHETLSSTVLTDLINLVVCI
jgi:hypothetical protein